MQSAAMQLGSAGASAPRGACKYRGMIPQLQLLQSTLQQGSYDDPTGAAWLKASVAQQHSFNSNEC